MARDEAYYAAERKIEEAQRSGAKELFLSGMGLTEIPEGIRSLTELQFLDIYDNHLTTIPDSLGELSELTWLNLFNNELTKLPESLSNLSSLRALNLNNNKLSILIDTIGQLRQLELLFLANNQLSKLPDSLGDLSNLQLLNISNNKLVDLPSFLVQLRCFDNITYGGNPLNPELIAAAKEGNNAFKRYLIAKATAQFTLNEAKLILVGEGEVGKTCLMDALLGKPWQEHPTTHGIEINQIRVTDPISRKELTLNGWDFGGQRVYRPTHQLFFSSPAVYLVVWKPREGSQQGFVKEWIKLIKHREPTAKILVVATHGGPGLRQPDIDRQEL